MRREKTRRSCRRLKGSIESRCAMSAGNRRPIEASSRSARWGASKLPAGIPVRALAGHDNSLRDNNLLEGVRTPGLAGPLQGIPISSQSESLDMGNSPSCVMCPELMCRFCGQFAGTEPSPVDGIPFARIVGAVCCDSDSGDLPGAFTSFQWRPSVA